MPIQAKTKVLIEVPIKKEQIYKYVPKTFGSKVITILMSLLLDPNKTSAVKKAIQQVAHTV